MTDYVMYPARHQNDAMQDDLARQHTDIHCEDDSFTQQHFATDADINVLAERYGITKGKMPAPILDASKFGDYSDAPDLKTALDILRDVDNHFNSLPPKIRTRFDNSPAKLWDFVHDPDNQEEGIRLGIFNPPAPPPQEPQVPKGDTPKPQS